MTSMIPPLPKHNIRAHVVILGAGASRACCPNGDAFGQKLPVIADFISILNLQPKLEAAGVFVEGEDFESLYSRLVTSKEHPALVRELEDEVFNYFTELRLPKQPTIYDHLVLSLRPKDLIASFNWDPFLIQAMRRCRSIAQPPRCLHLHGNVATGYCVRHQKPSIGDRGNNCQQCGHPFVDSRLLYPVAQKNYTADPLIDFAWKCVQPALQNCFLLTIFGYGAPATDVEAVKLMKEGWGNVDDRPMEETEIIDIRSKDNLRQTWDSFIHSHHYQTHIMFYDSMLGRLPRRSVEMMFREIVDAEFIEYFPLPKDADWQELREWAHPFVEQEEAAANAADSAPPSAS